MIPMDDSIDGYWAQLEATNRRIAEARSRNVRTTDYTVIRFDHTTRDRLWLLKDDKRLGDSVLICPEDGHRELVHMDMILSLGQMVPFYEKSPSQSDEGLDLYQVDRTISSALLKLIVFFAYNRHCELTEQLALSLAECADEFGIISLLDYCMSFLQVHIRDGIAVQALELAFYSSPEHKQYFQNYVEDNFDELWLKYQPDFMRLTYDTLFQLLTSDWLNVKSESTTWQVIEAWIAYEPESGLPRLSSLIKDALRFGRIPSSFNIQQSIVLSNLFQSQPIDVQQETSDFLTRVLDETIRTAKPIDGNGLSYDESTYNYRPRNPKQLLILAGGSTSRMRLPTGYKDSIQLYDYQLNLWRSSQVKLPLKNRKFDTQIIASTMYILGGVKQDGDNSEMFSLDLSQAEPIWATVPPMLNPRRTQFTSVVYKGKLVVIGGKDPNGKMVQCEQYDPSTRVWSEFAPLNCARTSSMLYWYEASATVHNERIYMAGGCDDYTSVEMYDPESNHWKLVAPLNTPYGYFSLITYLDQVLAVRVYFHTRVANSRLSVESYDPTTNLWTIETWVDIDKPDLYQGVQLNGELLVTGQYNGGGLYKIQNLGPNAQVVELSSSEKVACTSVAVLSSRLALPFYKL